MKLNNFLKRLGYENSEVEPCIFRKVEGDGVYLLIVYVDDILMIASDEEILWLHELFIDEFQWIKLDISKKLSYLGMQIEFLEGFVWIDMRSYVVKILAECEEKLTYYQAPRKKDLFTITEELVLDEEKKQRFHTIVAKLLYLAKRGRPDILTVVRFLCTRVKELTMDDQRKLLHLLGYLGSTKE
jgi:hypothetical protein